MLRRRGNPDRERHLAFGGFVDLFGNVARRKPGAGRIPADGRLSATRGIRQIGLASFFKIAGEGYGIGVHGE